MRWIIAPLLAVALSAAAQVPTDNPVAAHYAGPEGYPAWTDAIAWDRVIDMSKYATGRTNFEKFENARDELARQGGGALYYPAGTYDFSDMPADGPKGRGLLLKGGVIIRGEAPKGPADARRGSLDLPTKFIFGFRKKGIDEARKFGGEVPREWNIIGITPGEGQQLKDVNRVGICWVDLTGAVVYFGPQLNWGQTWGTAASWKGKFAKPAWKERIPDGTHPMDPFLGGTMGQGNYIGAGSGRLVFGCVLRDAAVLNDAFEEGNGPDAFYMFKFGARIAAYGNRVFIANNVLPKSGRNFLYAQTTRKTENRGGNSMRLGDFVPDTTILFDYGKTCGIDINKNMASAFGGGLLDAGIVVRDNWVFNHGHRGFNVSGTWVTLANNRNERIYLKGGADAYGIGGGWTLTLDGNLRSNAGGNGTISDNLSRAFDIGGKEVWIDGNFFHNVGSDPGNDGEGILCQAHGGTHVAGWAITRNTHEKGTGQKSYIGAWDVNMLGCLIGWNTTAGWVGMTKVTSREVVDCSFVGNTAAKVNAGGDVIVEGPKTPCAPPKDVKAAVQGDVVKITWADASEDEVAFRVERSVDGGKTWAAIAYRPRHAKNTDPDALSWADFTVPLKKPLQYRVAAVNGLDDGTGMSEAVAPR